MSYPFILTLSSRLTSTIDAIDGNVLACFCFIFFQNTVTQRRGNTAINALSKTARWRRCLQASRDTSQYIRINSIYVWALPVSGGGQKNKARNTYINTITVSDAFTLGNIKRQAAAHELGVKPEHVWCSEVLQTGIESHMRISDSASHV